MRITPISISNDMIYNLAFANEALEIQGDQLSSGKRIRKPSDDPGGAAYTIDLQTSVDLNGQYQKTNDSAAGWLESTGASLNQLIQIATRVRTLTVQASNDTNSSSDRVSLSNEVSQLLQQVVLVGNQTYGTNAIFGGTAVVGTPFNSIGGYSGNAGNIQHQVSSSYTMNVNTQASSVFTGQTGIYNTIDQVHRHLTASGQPIPPLNVGTEKMTLAGNNAGPANTSYLFKINSTVVINSNTYAATASYSTDGGATWTAATPVGAAGTPPSFQIGATGITASFMNGAVSPQVGDQFSFTTDAVPGSASNTYPINGGPNVGNESIAISGTYTGTGTPQFILKPSQLDTNNNVVGVQMSTDGGVTWTPTIQANEYQGVALAYPTTTTYTLGNGLTATLTQSSVFPSSVVTNGDTFTFSSTAQNLSNDLTSLDAVIAAITAQQAINGALQNTVTNTKTVFQTQSITLNKTLSTTSDADYTKVTTQYSTAQNLYQAALAVDAKSVEPSLIDYLK
jgi:flagellin